MSAPTKSLDPGSTWQGKHVVVSHYAKPDFSAMTAGKAAFGLFGAAAMISAGNELVKSENIEDPAIEISDRLANGLVEKRSAAMLPVCKVDPTDPNNPPTSDALRADHAALLKQSLHKAAEACVSDVEKQMRV